MNVQLFATVKRPEPAKATIKVSGSEIAEANGANRAKFEEVFTDGSRRDGIYAACCAPLVDLLISGYNVSTIVCGSSASTRSTVVNGAEGGGLLNRFIEDLFSRLEEEQNIESEAVSSLGTKKDSSLSVTMFEMNGPNATDLISSRRNLSIEEDAEHGDWFRLAEQKRVYSVAEGRQVLRDSWRRSCLFTKKDNPDSTALIAYIDLTMHFEATGEPHKSRYSLIVLPSVDGLVQNTEQSESIQSVAKTVSELSIHLHPDRVINYRENELTKHIQNELGGNCTTKVIACFDPAAELRVQRDFLKFCKNLPLVKNFPIMNDTFALHLVTQYRASIIHYRNIPPPSPAKPPTPIAPAAPVAHVKTLALLPPLPQPSNLDLEPLRYDNARLLDQVERLQLKLEQLNSKFTMMANSKAELSAQLVDCEEEKLKATKSYIDMQIENNKLREEMESMNYELNNKILTLEHDLQISDAERDTLTNDVSNLRQQLSHLEVDRKGLADEYISLKTSYMALTDDIEKEVAKNDELTMELLNLINAKSALAHQAESEKLKGEASALAREEERIRGVVHRLSHRGADMEKLRPDGQLKDSVEKELFGNQAHYQDQMNKLTEQHSEGRRQLLTRIESLEKEVASLRSLARERQQKISFMNARLITVGGENSELKAMNNRLQHKVKDINTEYRLRLTKYVEDISSHIDSAGTEKGEESLAHYVNKMIKDVKASHRAREDQLSQAAQSYKSRLETVVHKHEELLCAYRDLRAQVEALGLTAVDLGPDEHELIMLDFDLQSSQQKEIVKLQSEVHRLKISNKQLEDSQPKVMSDELVISPPNKPPPRPGTGTFADLDSWTSVRKQLRNFSEQTLRELEEERASLLSKNVILEEQLKESQDYIDKHLARYKEEINRLRQQLSYQTRS